MTKDQTAMARLIRPLSHLLVAALFAGITAIGLGGALQPVDNALRDQRFAASPRTPTGEVVFIDIDAQSLQRIGVWPWPRHVHADLLDRLMALGAGDVVFDVDFSVPSSESEDAAFETALQNAGGYAHLAAFLQHRPGKGPTDYNLPLERFRRFADPVSVNVNLDADGVVRSYPLALNIGGETVSSVASLFSSVVGSAGSDFFIDYAIDPVGIDRIPVADLIDGKVDPARIAGKDVIIGASAVELRDYFVVPRYGAIPGALLQALASESLRQGRLLELIDPWPAAVLIVVLGLAALIGRRRIPVPLALAAGVGVSLVTEATAWWLQLRAGLLFDTGAIHLAAFAFVATLFVSELVRRGEQRARATRERDSVRRILDRVITDNFDGVVIAGVDGGIVAASAFAEKLLGRPLQGDLASSVLPGSFAELLQSAIGGSDRQGELTLKLGETERILEYVVTHSSVELASGPSPVACLTFRDISARRRAEDKLRYLGDHDTLTGALSRNRFVELIEAAVHAKRDVGVVVVDLRRFRIINDTLGHSQGDLLLKQVVSRLHSMGPDAVARLGGDSFALLVPGMDPEKLRGFCETVAQWLAFPYQLADDHQAIIAACAGATCTAVSGHDPAVLLSHADMALSAAKQRSGNGVALFTPDMDDRLKSRQEMDAALRQALARRDFTLHFQPQVDLVYGELAGAEALCRWTHPTLGPIPPDRFIAAAEETGLIVELGRWALEEACAVAARWPRPLRVAVNVSPVQFELSDVVDDVRVALGKSGLPAEQLEIEITESMFVRDLEAVTTKLRALRQMGVAIALDDFGTGYSSLSYLGQLPVDRIKVDQSFVRRLPGDSEAAAIIRTVISLCETLGRTVIAEGIETADQAWMLQMMGCTHGQGYHFGRPIPESAFVRKFDERPVRLVSAGVTHAGGRAH